MLPVGNQTTQQIGTTKYRAVGRFGTSNGHVIASAGARMASVYHKFIGTETGIKRLFVQSTDVVHQLLPTCRRMNVNLNHTRIWRDHQFLNTVIGRRRVAFNPYGHLQFLGSGFYGGY